MDPMPTTPTRGSSVSTGVQSRKPGQLGKVRHALGRAIREVVHSVASTSCVTPTRLLRFIPQLVIGTWEDARRENGIKETIRRPFPPLEAIASFSSSVDEQLGEM
jgi:hypothetical protein